MRHRVLLVVVVALGTMGFATEAQAFHTRAASYLKTDRLVELTRKSFDLHDGNKLCPDKRSAPENVGRGTRTLFCYEADKPFGAGAYDTEYRLRYSICAAASPDSRCEPSGYDLVAHVLIRYAGFSDNIIDCAVERVNHSLPAKHFDCELTTERSAKKSRDPAPTLTVTYTPTPPNAPRVYFIGDSVTAGFGYCGTEGGTDSADITCKPNEPFANAWFAGNNALKDCQPPEKINDRCSNNNYLGNPWNTGPWAPDPNAPNVAYSYVIAREQRGPDPALIYNWAITGSTPANWDDGGLAGHLASIKNSYVVMTLGANPMLSFYLHIALATEGKCAKTTFVHRRVGKHTFTYAAPLDGELHGDRAGVLRCFNEQWAAEQQSKHLVNVYKRLIDNGNRVLVMGYPAVCPWSFGEWQPSPNFFNGPASGKACTSETREVWDGHGKRISQSDQAKLILGDANGKISAAVAEAASGAPGKIAFALPDQGAWASHQAWDGDSWVFKNDTWVHPSVAGHKQLAATVVKAMCSDFRHWCGSPPQWG